MATVYLYRYREYVQLVQADRGVPNINMPMIIYDTKVYKGVTSTIEFVIRNNDRKSISLVGYNLTAQIRRVDNISNATVPTEVLLEKTLVPIDETAGKYKLILDPDEVEDWSTGYYRYNIRTVDINGRVELLYTDINKSTWNAFELIEGISSSMVPAIQINADKFTPTPIGEEPTVVWRSSAMPGDSQTQRASGTHTFAIYTNNWLGKIWVEGSLSNDPPRERDWFPIPLGIKDNYFEYTKDTKADIKLINFTMNLYWVRFSFQESAGNQGRFLRILYKS
jgi:hypothetical protein